MQKPVRQFALGNTRILTVSNEIGSCKKFRLKMGFSALKFEYENRVRFARN